MGNVPQSDEDSGKQKPRPGWLNDLAERSAGVTPPSSSGERSEPKKEKTGWSYAGLGIEFAGTTILFALMGVYIDGRFKTMPWGTLVLSALGFIGGMYLLIKDALKENAAPREDAGKHSPPQG